MNQDEPKFADHVILMRHAHVQDDFTGNEFDRPLSARGREAARAAARAMHGGGHHPGPLLVSATRHARETAEIMMSELVVPRDEVHIIDGLHEAPPEVLEARIRVLAKPYTLVTLVGHNPGLTDLARFLAQEPGAAPLQPAEWRYLPWPPP